jgi:hypothetical protein
MWTIFAVFSRNKFQNFQKLNMQIPEIANKAFLTLELLPRRFRYIFDIF